jgi:hypothetical protein
MTSVATQRLSRVARKPEARRNTEDVFTIYYVITIDVGYARSDAANGRGSRDAEACWVLRAAR